MELQHLNFKFFARKPYPNLEPFVPVFHRWIQEQVFSPGLLIDVADYRHVPQGPGIVLIGYEYDFNLDESDGRLGLRFNQKAILAGSIQDKIKQSINTALRGLQLLKQDLPKGTSLAFEPLECEVCVNDRALAPNTPATLEALKPEFQKYFESAYGKCTLTHNPDPRVRFGFTVQCERPLE